MYFLSTVHNPSYAADVQQEDQVVRRRSKQGVVNVTSPPLLKDYNKYMCGIDRADQNNRYYSVGRQSKRWPPRVVFHQMETSINNAFQIYKVSSPNPKSSREFRMQLATELVNVFYVPGHQRVGRKRANPDIEPRLQNVGVHIPLVGLVVFAVCVRRLVQWNTNVSTDMSQRKTHQREVDHLVRTYTAVLVRSTCVLTQTKTAELIGIVNLSLFEKMWSALNCYK